MKTLALIVPLLSSGCQAELKRVESVTAEIIPKVSKSLSSVISVPTVSTHFTCSFPKGVVTIRVYHGTNSTAYFETFDVPASTNFYVMHRHWAKSRDYFDATSIDQLGVESERHSNQVFTPPLPPDRMTITSLKPTTVQYSLNLKVWSDLGPAPLTVLMNQPVQVFRGKGATNELAYQLSNPLNQ